MSGDSWAEMLGEAQQRLSEQEEHEVGELGESIDFAADPQFRGRWRGVGQLETKRGPTDVYLLWDLTGARRFAFAQAGLVREIDEVRPGIGDEVLILRGPARAFEKDGEQRSFFPYAVRTRACSDPLPEAAAAVPDDDIPF